jgi:diacylglycerol O-acyltransferase
MQQLTGIDANFLYMRTGVTVGHVCGVALLDVSTRDGELTFDAVRNRPRTAAGNRRRDRGSAP